MPIIVTTLLFCFVLSVVSCGMFANWLTGGSVSLDAWNQLAVIWGIAVPFIAVSGFMVWAELE